VKTIHFSVLLCQLLGHRWKHWEGGHVYADEQTWAGARAADGTPWVHSFTQCERCGATKGD